MGVAFVNTPAAHLFLGLFLGLFGPLLASFGKIGRVSFIGFGSDLKLEFLD